MAHVLSTLLAQQSDVNGPMLAVIVVVELALIVLVVAGLWKVFEKAGEPGWAAIVPIYNFIVMLKIAEKPMWWIVLCFIPFVSLIPAILVPIEIAKNFGKGVGFALGMIFLPFIFYPLLGFGDAQYAGQGAPMQRGFPVMPPR